MIKQYLEKPDNSFWDKMWNNYDISNSFLFIKYFKIYKVVKSYINKDGPILEAGCGISQWVYNLDKEGYNITGIDYANKTVKKINNLYPSLKVYQGDIFNISYNDKSFEFYLSWGVMEHYEEGPDKILKETYRVLKDDGKLFVSVPYLNPIRKVFMKNIKSNNKYFYQYLYEEKEFKNILKNNGFNVIKTYKFNWIKGLFDFLKNKNSNEKNDIRINKPRDNKPRSLIKKYLKILMIKIEDLSFLTYLFGHMIMFICVKDSEI